jgi:histidyl-tRNA synthetase
MHQKSWNTSPKQSKKKVLKKSLKHFEDVLKYLREMNISFEVNPYLVRGLDYYTHTTFEFKGESDNLGATKDTILAGGRYNDLVETMGGPKVPAIGWACGIERLKLLLPQEQEEENLISFIFVPNLQEEKILFSGLKIIDFLRKNGKKVTYEEGKVSKQIEKSNLNNSSICLILGEEEMKQESIKVKNMKNGKEEIIKIKEILLYV